MPKRDRNVLLFDKLPARKDLRAAVARIIRSVQHEHHETDEETAQNIGVSIGTVRNARNEESDLNALTIAAIGKRYGPESVYPYMALFGARAVSLDATIGNIDALPSMTGAVHKLAVAGSGLSDGGTAVSHNELAAMLPELREASRVINALIARADRIGLAA